LVDFFKISNKIVKSKEVKRQNNFSKKRHNLKLREENNMRKYPIVILAIVFSLYMFGCGKKQQALEEMQQPMSMEMLSTMNTSAPVAPEAKAPEAQPRVTSQSPVVAAGLEPLPPVASAKPTATQIQTALKNADFYAGEIDGKIGPMSKKAITEFQKANGLEADGKVGPKTWAMLSTYLKPPAESQPMKTR
jgi:murein L,D-transpeptidase YcbB/YkuD